MPPFSRADSTTEILSVNTSLSRPRVTKSILTTCISLLTQSLTAHYRAAFKWPPTFLIPLIPPDSLPTPCYLLLLTDTPDSLPTPCCLLLLTDFPGLVSPRVSLQLPASAVLLQPQALHLHTAPLFYISREPSSSSSPPYYLLLTSYS